MNLRSSFRWPSTNGWIDHYMKSYGFDWMTVIINTCWAEWE